MPNLKRKISDGTWQTITPAADFPAKVPIEVTDADLVSLSVTENGTYNPYPHDGFSSVFVRSGSVVLSSPTVNASTGVVTASASVETAGWVGSAPASKTLQLPTQAAKTVTPTTSEQTAVDAGKYTTGAVKVAAVPTETKNITANGTYAPTSGKFFSSVTVNVQGGGGGGVPLPSQIAAGDTPVILGTNGGYGVNSTKNFVLISEITIKQAGTYSIRWVATCQDRDTGYYYTRLLKNGTQVGPDYDIASQDSHSQIYNVSIQCNAGDVIAIYCKGYSSTYDVSVSGFMACIDWDNTF